jgi:ACS family hexuronate transporter-like MFS transporter
MAQLVSKTRGTFIIPHLRWWICGLLFASTAINYIYRQTFNVLAPYLKIEFHWTNSDFALILIGFRIAYALGETASGRFLDWLGTRLGLLITVSFYSVSAVLTGFATGLRSFAVFRFLVGAGESANWPGATKSVSEWFPKAERGWAIAIFDSGSAVGGAIVPALVLWLYHHFGTWRPVFFSTGFLGFLWVLAWRFLYYPPESHPHIGAAEREMLRKAKEQEANSESRAVVEGFEDTPASWLGLLKIPHTWGIILSRSVTDPVWFLIMEWFAIYLVSKGFKLENTLLGFAGPYIAGDLGNFFGGGLSSELIRRGWPVLRARKFVIILGTIGMILLVPVVYTSSLTLIVLFFSIASFAYATWSTMLLALPADLYPSSAVGSVTGVSLTGGGIGTILSTFLIGTILDHYSFKPVLIAASLAPMIGTGFLLLLVRSRGVQAEA